jgi:hypothetical protein
MNCIDFKNHMDKFIEGNMDDELYCEMESHIEKCTLCRDEYESTVFIVDSLRDDALSISLNDSRKRDLKNMINKLPGKKRVDFSSVIKNMTYVAAIFMFITVGIHFAGGVDISIDPKNSNGNALEVQIGKLASENSELKDQNTRLAAENYSLRRENSIYRIAFDGGEMGNVNQRIMAISYRLERMQEDGSLLDPESIRTADSSSNDVMAKRVKPIVME